MTRNFIYAALTLAVTLTAHGQELFLTANDAVERLEPEPSVVRSRSAVFDKNQLLDSLSDGSPLVLNLYPDARFEATVEQSRTVSRDNTFVYAVLEDGRHATFFVAGGIVRGEVHSPQGIFTVRSNGKGLVRIEQLDSAESYSRRRGSKLARQVLAGGIRFPCGKESPVDLFHTFGQ